MPSTRIHPQTRYNTRSATARRASAAVKAAARRHAAALRRTSHAEIHKAVCEDLHHLPEQPSAARLAYAANLPPVVRCALRYRDRYRSRSKDFVICLFAARQHLLGQLEDLVSDTRARCADGDEAAGFGPADPSPFTSMCHAAYQLLRLKHLDIVLGQVKEGMERRDGHVPVLKTGVVPNELYARVLAEVVEFTVRKMECSRLEELATVCRQMARSMEVAVLDAQAAALECDYEPPHWEDEPDDHEWPWLRPAPVEEEVWGFGGPIRPRAGMVPA